LFVLGARRVNRAIRQRDDDLVGFTCVHQRPDVLGLAVRRFHWKLDVTLVAVLIEIAPQSGQRASRLLGRGLHRWIAWVDSDHVEVDPVE
jgi:hypothetical protein